MVLHAAARWDGGGLVSFCRPTLYFLLAYLAAALLLHALLPNRAWVLLTLSCPWGEGDSFISARTGSHRGRKEGKGSDQQHILHLCVTGEMEGGNPIKGTSKHGCCPAAALILGAFLCMVF